MSTRIILIYGLLFLFTSLFLQPIAIGAGTGFGDADEKLPGTFTEIVESDAFYKVDCSKNEVLLVVINHTTQTLILTIHNPSQQLIKCDGPNTNKTESVQITCNSDGFYYINVTVDGFSIGSYGLTVRIELTGESSIPSFHFFMIFYSIILLIGIAMYFKPRKVSILGSR